MGKINIFILVLIVNHVISEYTYTTSEYTYTKSEYTYTTTNVSDYTNGIDCGNECSKMCGLNFPRIREWSCTPDNDTFICECTFLE